MLRGHRELYERTRHLIDKAKEVTYAANDARTWVSPSQPAPGVRTRKLYRPGVLLDPTGAQHARFAATAGAQVRITTTELTEALVVDRRVAILAGDGSFTVVWIPDVVAGVHALLETAWGDAADLADYERDYGETCLMAPRMLELLGSGATDGVAARSMGLSLRTYRRQVTQLLVTLGATSRFQAGARARELGLL